MTVVTRGKVRAAAAMLRPTRHIVAISAAFSLAGCAIAPNGVTGCNCVRHQLAVPDPAPDWIPPTPRPASASGAAGVGPGDAAEAAPKIQSDAFASDMDAAFRAHARYRLPGNSFDSMLFLSGGSQHGAFGAGFLQRWQERRGGTLPDFVVVTGVSTGSLLATFAFVGDADAAAAGYKIMKETDLITPYAKPSGGKLGLSGAKALITKGALADLAPLERRLDKALSERILQAVADQARRARKLYVGVVNIDTGQAEAIDLTDLAQRWAAAAPGSAARVKLKSCYIHAILASSSAPVAAPAVFIDNRMYVDGGARFGVFSDEIGAVLNPQGLAVGLANPRIVYILMNGNQATQVECGTMAAICAQVGPPGWQENTAHAKWSFLDLALRSEDIVTNQIYRFSADQIALRAQVNSRGYRFVKIGNDVGTFSATLDVPGLAHGTKKCAQWNDDDAVPSPPLQFHPRYMRCLIEYGRAIADSKINGSVDDPEYLWDPDIHPQQDSQP